MVLPQSMDYMRTKRLCAHSCIVPRRPGRNPPTNRSPKGYRTPRSTCSDGCSIADRTVAAAVADGDPQWSEIMYCNIDISIRENRPTYLSIQTTIIKHNLPCWFVNEGLTVVVKYSCGRQFIFPLQNTTVTATTTSGRREDDLLCAFACTHHIHTRARTDTHTHTQTLKTRALARAQKSRKYKIYQQQKKKNVRGRFLQRKCKKCIIIIDIFKFRQARRS